MQDYSIHLQGMNIRIPDREAAPGVMRMIRNMFPTGDLEKPIWKRASDAVPFYTHTAATDEPLTIRGGIAWFRANQGAELIYLAIGEEGKDALFSIGMTSDGQVLPSLQRKVLWEFSDASDARRARFAQVGDTLVVCITRNDEGEEMLVLSNGDDNTTICLPFNLPQLPAITYPVNYNGYYPTDVKKYFGFRFAYELLDGSFVRHSNVVLRYSFGQIEGDARRYFYPNIVASVEAPILEVTNYKKIIKGLAIFVSEPKDSFLQVLNEAVFYKIGIITDLFGVGAKSVVIHFTDVDLLTNPIFEEDNLLSHAVYGKEVFSYNKLLLIGDAGYDFQVPWSPTNVQTTPIIPGSQIYGVPQDIAGVITTDPEYYFLRIYTTNWTNYAGNAWNIIRTTIQYKGRLANWDHPEPAVTSFQEFDWYTIHSGPSNVAVSVQVRIHEEALLKYRIRHEYKDGNVSDWVEYTPVEG